jgi:hypothetical protein
MTMPQLPPYGPYQYQPPPRKRRTGRKILLGFLAFAGVILIVGVIAAVAGGGKTPAGSTSISTPAVTPAAAQPAATSAAPKSPTRVRFVVTGSAPGGADITYGSNSDNRNAPGSLGPLGTGAPVPWRGSVAFDGSALYYSVTAQLDSAGDVTCKIVVTGPGDAPLTVASGHASGQYSICSAQAAPNDPSGLNWSKE